MGREIWDWLDLKWRICLHPLEKIEKLFTWNRLYILRSLSNAVWITIGGSQSVQDFAVDRNDWSIFESQSQTELFAFSLFKEKGKERRKGLAVGKIARPLPDCSS